MGGAAAKEYFRKMSLMIIRMEPDSSHPGEAALSNPAEAGLSNPAEAGLSNPAEAGLYAAAVRT